MVEMIRKDLRQDIQKELKIYFDSSPLVVNLQDHYDDHKFVHGIRDDLKDVKRSFLQKVATLFAIFIAGGFSFTYLIKLLKGE